MSLEMNHNHQLKLYLIKTLINYINRYLKKGFFKDYVFIESKRNLKKNESITMEQFNFIIKFIERERPFKNLNRTQIHNYFSIIIEDNSKIEIRSSLEEFMV
jgi:hypothetical protein